MQTASSLRTLLVRTGLCARANTPLLSFGSTRALSTSQPNATDSTQESDSSATPKLVVFGGRGFVGSHVCREAVRQGLDVVAVSPSGTPPLSDERWVDGVAWVRGNALEPRSYAHLLQGATGVISCVGAFGSQSHMLKVNGTANVTTIHEAAAAGVPRFVFVSAHIPNVPGLEYLIGGYVQGKQQAEEALREAFPTSGVALRPSMIYGDRRVSANVTLPLGLVGAPLEALAARAPKALLGVPLLGALAVPPVPVEAVARAAVRAATDPSVPAGVIDPWGLEEYK